MALIVGTQVMFNGGCLENNEYVVACLQILYKLSGSKLA
jgi:hypothetical protein